MKTRLFFSFLTLLVSTSIFAENIVCHTPGELKIIKVADQSVKFYADYDSVFNNREIASTESVRDNSNGKTIDKVLLYLGERYTIHIAERGSFSSINDYLTIRSNKGHEVIYPLECKFL